MPILGSYNSAANKDMVSKICEPRVAARLSSLYSSKLATRPVVASLEFASTKL